MTYLLPGFTFCLQILSSNLEDISHFSRLSYSFCLALSAVYFFNKSLKNCGMYMKFLSKLNRLKQYIIFIITSASFKIFSEGNDVSFHITTSMAFSPYVFISKKLKWKKKLDKTITTHKIFSNFYYAISILWNKICNLNRQIENCFWYSFLLLSNGLLGHLEVNVYFIMNHATYII